MMGEGKRIRTRESNDRKASAECPSAQSQPYQRNEKQTLWWENPENARSLPFAIFAIFVVKNSHLTAKSAENAKRSLKTFLSMIHFVVPFRSKENVQCGALKLNQAKSNRFILPMRNARTEDSEETALQSGLFGEWK
jgi:hypothetical protein